MTIEKIIGSGGGCFKAGTQVQLENGKTISIELIKEGDSILAFDEHNDIHLAKVTKLHIHEDPQPLLNVKFWNGEIFITPNHWVLNQYNAFVEIGTLTQHDAVVDGMGHLRPIISINAVENETVYNLTVEPYHTFIANCIRVHNGGHRERFPTIVGSGGGGGKGSGGSPRQAVEASDTLQSKATISVIDLIGEGKIGGLINGAKSIFLNSTALMSEAGQYNFDATTFDSRNGTPNQSVIAGFSSIETPYSMSNIEFTTVSPKTFSITNLNVDRVRIIVSIAALTSQNMSTGDISGSSVTYRFEISVDGAAYVQFGSNVTITGKTKSKYQRSTVLTLPTATVGWTIKLIRVTADSTSASLQNKTYFDSYVELTDANLNYPNSALVTVNLDPTTFSSVPTRSYLVNGLYVQIPNNIGIDANGKATGIYTGIWNGGFTTAISSNPAWILYDLLTSTRYGLGNYLGSTQVDKSMLYTIGKYCDELVDDGFGGQEARFTINTQLQTQAEAYKIISDITSVFRGMAYWNGGMVCFRQDSPATPTMVFNQANVVNGEFSYSSSSRKDRHSVVNVTWNDPDYNYKQRVEYVEDHDLVNSSMGIKKVNTVAFGCSSRGQAQRVGRWMLYSEKYESNVITFNVGLDSSLLFPGEIIKICDSFRAGKRTGGRIISCSSTSATLDAPVTLSLGSGLTAVASVSIFIAMADGSFVERVLTQTTGTFTTLTWTTALTTLPLDNAVFVLSDEVVPMLARVVSIAQDGKHADLFTVSAVEHNPSKFGAIESGLVLTKPKTGIAQPYITVLSNLTLTESTYFIAPGVIGSKVHVSWEGQATVFNVSKRISKTASKVLITNSASNVLTTSVDHGLTTGIPVNYYYAGTTISGLSANTIYYAVVLTTTTFKLATTQANAIATTPTIITLGSLTNNSSYFVASANPIIGNWESRQVNAPIFDIESLAENDILDIKVSGLDLLGVWSTPITATLTIAGKSTPPKPVATFTATGLIRSIQLRWTYPADMDIDFDHVNIRWSATSNVEESATLLTAIRADNYLVSGLNFASTPYYFWIKTVDTSGNESLQSVYVSQTTLDEAGTMVTTLNGMLGSSSLNAELGTRLSLAEDSFDPFQTWYFTLTTESWAAINATLTWANTGVVTLTSTAANPQLISPSALSIVGSTYTIVKAKVNRLAGTTGWSGSLYYKTTGSWTLAKTIVMPYGLNTVGNSALLEFNMIGITGWTSTTAANPITQIRLDIGSTTASGDSFSIDWIGIGRSAPGSSSQALVAAQSSINGLNASYTVKIDANGYVAGYGLASETNTAGVTTSSFAIRADKFSIANPNGPGQSAPIIPFSVLTTPTTIDGSIFPAGVYIDTAYITKITADKIDSRGLSIRDAFGNIILGSGNALDWGNIDGAAKPADNATNTTVYSQNIAPASPHEGDIWYVNDTLSASKRADGCATKGKTKGRMI
jgi:predicted phage tail protein